MGLFDRLFGRLFGSHPKPPAPPAWRTWLWDRGFDPEHQLTGAWHEGRLVRLYARGDGHEEEGLWRELFADPAITDLDELLITGHDTRELRPAVQSATFPALRRLEIGALEGMDNAEYDETYNLRGGTQGSWPSIRRIAPVLEELVVHEATELGDLPTTLRRLTVLDFGEFSSFRGPAGVPPPSCDPDLSALEELTLSPSDSSLLARDDLTSLRTLRLGNPGFPSLACLARGCTAFPALERIELHIQDSLYREDAEALAALVPRMPCPPVIFLLEETYLDEPLDDLGLDLTYEDSALRFALAPVR